MVILDRKADTIKLRDYQLELVDRAMDALERDRTPIVQLATAGGKTVIGSALAGEWNGQVAVVSHRRFLSGQWKDSAGDRVRVYTVQSRIEGWVDYGPVDLLIVDEAHHYHAQNTWGQKIAAFPGHRLGLTATPARTSEREGLLGVWDDLIIGPPKRELIDAGHLVPLHLPTVAELIQGTEVLAGDYTDAGIQGADGRTLESASREALDLWSRDRRTSLAIFFAVSVSHAEMVVAVLEAMGLPAALITGDTDEDVREGLFAGFADGKVGPLVTVAVLTEGLDLPACEQVVILRPTKSDILWLQMAGRCQRPAPGKEQGLVLDYAGNHLRLPHPDADREWSLTVSLPPGDGGGDGVKKACARCGVAVGPSAWECRSCGFQPQCPECGITSVRPYAPDAMCETCRIAALEDLEALMNSGGGEWQLGTSWHGAVEKGGVEEGQWFRWDGHGGYHTCEVLPQSALAYSWVNRVYDTEVRRYEFQVLKTQRGASHLLVVGEGDRRVMMPKSSAAHIAGWAEVKATLDARQRAYIEWSAQRKARWWNPVVELDPEPENPARYTAPVSG